VTDRINDCFFYIGRYCNADAYTPLIIQAVKGELAFTYCQAGGLRALGHMFAGEIEAMAENSSTERIAD